MQKLFNLRQNLRRHQRNIKVLPLNLKPYWYLFSVTICTGIAAWGSGQIVKPAWWMFGKILDTDPTWDASAAVYSLMLIAITFVWGWYALLCHVHMAALVDRLKHDWN